MGGQILSQRLENIKSKDGQSATNYFKAYEKETMPMWMKYVEFLNDFSNKNDSLKDEIIEGAEQTYGAIERIMLEVGD
jgi:heme oxygenase